MARTTLSFATAGLLACLVGGVVWLRHHALGDDVRLPAGPGTWKLTLVVQGRIAEGGRLEVAVPLETARQHVVSEKSESETLAPREASRTGKLRRTHAPRREQAWALKSGAAPGPFRARYEARVTLTGHVESATGVHAAPEVGEFVRAESGIEVDDESVARVARDQTEGLSHPADQAQALFNFVDKEIGTDPTVADDPATASQTLAAGSGDSVAKSRLLVALLRNRGVPARLVVGLPLERRGEQRAHAWVEAWVRGPWLSMDPSLHVYGRLPRAYLTLAVGDPRVVVGKKVTGLSYAFLAERGPSPADESASALRRFFVATSPFSLPPAEQKLVEFLLLLPLAAVIVCVFRNVVGVTTFGTFAPALLGLAFREARSLTGAAIFVAILIAGWLVRRGLDRFHLLQVPRSSLVLTLVVTMLVGFITASRMLGLQATQYIAVFPLVILTGMIERFWTIEEEDGAGASFRTLLVTVGVAGAIGLLLSSPAVARHMFRYPETVGLVMAVLLLLGRYTGYRLSELYRFRDVDIVAPKPAAPPASAPPPVA